VIIPHIELKAFGLEGGVSVGLRVNSGEVGIFSIAKKELLTKYRVYKKSNEFSVKE